MEEDDCVLFFVFEGLFIGFLSNSYYFAKSD